jgi:probable F420-dependent oxidoreductase
MKFGLFSMNMDACSYPEGAARIAQLAEVAGFESLWAGEHVVVPDPRVPPSRMEPEDRILDPLIALAFLAAHTTTIRLGTGIIILPQRNPLVLAKELASLDALSGGRLILGVGVGYVEAEFRALGVRFAERGARTDDYLAAMRAIWTPGRAAYRGRFVAFAGVQAHPQPTHLPIVVGGHSPGAYRRAVAVGDGWYGFGLDLAETARSLAGLREAASHHARPESLGELEITVTPPGLPTRDEARRFAALGVHRLILMPPRLGGTRLEESALADYVSTVGETLIGHV